LHKEAKEKFLKMFSYFKHETVCNLLANVKKRTSNGCGAGLFSSMAKENIYLMQEDM
jgi:hypothetical protein